MAERAAPKSRTDQPGQRAGRGLGQWAALAVSIVLLLGGVVFAWPGQIDDAYISLVFSHELADAGRLAWSDGRLVEGYSNLAWVLAGSLAAVLQLDGSWLLQLLALLATVGTLLALAPGRDATTGSVGFLVPVLIAAAEPTAWWAANAMETPAFGLCLALGWRALLVTERIPLGIVMLSLSALLRPEGHLHLVLALMVTHPRLLRSNLPTVAAIAAAFGVYHMARISYFGELLPLPTMVKGADGPGVLKGLRQAGLDLAPWVGLLGISASLSRVGTRAQGLALLPLLIQVAVLSKAGGDWMGHSRLVLPGVIAALGVWTTRQQPLPTRWALLLLIPLAALPALVVSPVGAPTQPRARDIGAIVSSIRHPRLDLDTTLMADLQFVIPRVPPGAMVYAGDVGMLGHVPDLIVRDMVGLTDADIARSRAYGDREALARTLARLDGGPDSAICLRMVGWGAPTAPALPPAQDGLYSVKYELADAWSTIRWSCRLPLDHDSALSEQRWAQLAQRFPLHSWIQWNHALAIAENGDVERAADKLVATSAPWRWSPWQGNERAALLFTTSPGPLQVEDGSWFVLAPQVEIKTRPLSSRELAELRLEFTFDTPSSEVLVTVVGGSCRVNRRVDASDGVSSLQALGCEGEDGPFRVAVESQAGQPGRVRQQIR